MSLKPVKKSDLEKSWVSGRKGRTRKWMLEYHLIVTEGTKTEPAYFGAIYDVDDFPARHVDQTAILCKQISTEETTYHAIWSNQCIELWFLLHFCYLRAKLHRSEYWAKLSYWLMAIGAGIYQKNRNDMYQVLEPYMDQAIVNAKKLDEENEGLLPPQAAPGTKVYEVIENLKPYLLEV